MREYTVTVTVNGKDIVNKTVCGFSEYAKLFCKIEKWADKMGFNYKVVIGEWYDEVEVYQRQLQNGNIQSLYIRTYAERKKGA